MSTYVLRKGLAKLSDLADAAGSVTGYPGDYLGRGYYVDNINGSAGATVCPGGLPCRSSPMP